MSALLATATAQIHAPVNKVWQTLLSPASMKEYMMGMQPSSDWKAGSPLRWIGRHDEDPNNNARGVIFEKEENRSWAFTFFYPGYGYPDEARYYNTVRFTLGAQGDTTHLKVEQGDFSVFKEGESYRQHSQTFWDGALKLLKELAEKN